ncbi:MULTISPECIES: hypothetical protein [unclassified Nocardiopsis]|uniref:hypothetical protein n=1 Tax=unclassified Nocardiopsis TaxID=2649073 RepID=UPI0033DA875A
MSTITPVCQARATAAPRAGRVLPLPSAGICGTCNGEGGSWVTGSGGIREWVTCGNCHGRGTT